MHHSQPTAFHRPRLIAPLQGGLKNLLLLACGCAFLSVSALATPTEEITRAIAVNGVTDVSKAAPRQFMKAFTAVVLRAQPRDLPDYVIAALNLRPDLSPYVVAVTVKVAVKNGEAKPATLCAAIERIVRAAIAANPDGAVSIAKAAASSSVSFRRCALSAAIAAAPEKKDEIVEAAGEETVPYAFLTVSPSDASGFAFSSATMNPANISDLAGNGVVNSPEQPPSH